MALAIRLENLLNDFLRFNKVRQLDLRSGSLNEQVERVLAMLPEKDRDLLKQVFWQERGRDEICRDFGVDRNYLRVLVHRAKSRVREILEARDATARRMGA